MQEVIQKYKQYITAGLILAVIFFSVRACNNNQLQKTAGENKILKEQVKKEKDAFDIIEAKRLREKDSIYKKIAEKEKEVQKLKDKISQSDFKIAELEVKAGKDKVKIKNMSLQKVADTLNVIYGGKNAVATDKDISVKNQLPNQLVETVVDLNLTKSVITEKDKQLIVYDSIVSAKDKVISGKNMLLDSAEKSLKESKELNNLQTNLNTNLEKENKKLKTRSTLDRILVPISLAAGIFIGVKTAGK